MKRLFAAAALAASLFVAAPAAAVVFTAEGESYEANFNGLIDGDPVDGLTSTILLTLSDISADLKTWTFTYAAENTSTSPDQATSRLIGFGFNTDPNMSGLSSSGLFDGAFMDAQFVFLGPREGCLSVSNSCSGGNTTGLEPGETGGGSFILTFGSATGSLAMTDLAVRYQSLGADGQGSGAGIEIPGPIPEPATWAMMIIGFGMVGMGLRMVRRREDQLLAA